MKFRFEVVGRRRKQKKNSSLTSKALREFKGQKGDEGGVGGRSSQRRDGTLGQTARHTRPLFPL